MLGAMKALAAKKHFPKAIKSSQPKDRFDRFDYGTLFKR